MSEELRLALLMFAVPAAGRATLDALGCRFETRALGFALAVAAGFAVLSLALYLPLALTGRVHFWPALALLALGAGRWALAFARGGRRSLIALRNPFWAGIAIFAVVLVSSARIAPYWGYDAKAIYGIKGKALLHERSLQGALFQDPEVVHYHGDYPLGLPLVMAFSAWAAVGPPEDPTGEQSMLTIAGWLGRHQSIDAYSSVACLWLLGMLAFAVHFARDRTRGPVSIVLLTTLALPLAVIFPWVGRRSFSLEGADVPLALTLGACGWLFVRALDPAERGARLASAGLAAASVLLKNEASVVLASLLVAVALCEGPRRSWRPGLWVVGGALLAGGMARALAATTVGAPYDEHYVAALAGLDLALLVERLPLLWQSTTKVLGQREMLAYWAFVLCVAVPWGLVRGGTSRIWALWVLGHVGAMTAIFLVTPNSVTWHVTTALPRLWCQVVVAAAALSVTTLADAWGQLVRDDDGAPLATTAQKPSSISSSSSASGT